MNITFDKSNITTNNHLAVPAAKTQIKLTTTGCKNLKLEQAINRLIGLKWSGKIIIKFFPEAKIKNITAKVLVVKYKPIIQKIERELKTIYTEVQNGGTKYNISIQK